jgi:ABC-type glycerol-3-phosphate transport system substrate-binding protein
MKKIKLTGLFLIVLALGITSCGKSAKTETVVEQKPKVKITTVAERK